MAALVGARLAAVAHGPAALPLALRTERAGAARHWLGALSLAAPVRAALTRLMEATMRDEPTALGAALGNVIEVTAPHLDRKSRLELERLVRTIGA